MLTVRKWCVLGIASFLPVITTVIVGHKMYQTSLESQRKVSYWTPTHYQIVEELSTGSDEYLICSRRYFTNVVGTNMVSAFVGTGGVFYFYRTGGESTLILKEDYNLGSLWGMKPVSVRASSMNGHAVLVGERSWLYIIFVVTRFLIFISLCEYILWLVGSIMYRHVWLEQEIP